MDLVQLLMGNYMYTLAFYAMAASAGIISLAYMMGEFFGIASLKGFARMELGELATTGVIIIIALLLVWPGGIFDMVSGGFIPSGQLGKVCDEWKDAHGSLAYSPIGTPYYKNGSIAVGQADYFLGCKPKLTLSGLEIEGELLPKLSRA